MNKYTQNIFKKDSEPTVGVEFGSQNITFPDNRVIRIQIWDTAGQETFKSITKSYYKGAISAILVYDCTKKSSFENLSFWIKEVTETNKGNVSCIIVGNKYDLEEEIEVTEEEGRKFAEQNGVLFLPSSAKTGKNIDLIFKNLAKIILTKIDSGEIDPNNELGIKKGNNWVKESSKDQSNNNKQNAPLLLSMNLNNEESSNCIRNKC